MQKCLRNTMGDVTYTLKKLHPNYTFLNKALGVSLPVQEACELRSTIHMDMWLLGHLVLRTS